MFGCWLADVWITNCLGKDFSERRMDKGTKGKKIRKISSPHMQLKYIVIAFGRFTVSCWLMVVLSASSVIVDLYSCPQSLLLLRNIPAAWSSDQLCPEQVFASSAPVCVRCYSEFQERQNMLVQE